MECTLGALIACFSWSGLYLDTQVSVVDKAVPRWAWTDVSPPPSNGVIQTSHMWQVSDHAENPYMRNAIGYQIRFKSMDLSAEFFHDSSMSTNRDRGVNGFAIQARWYPFR